MRWLLRVLLAVGLLAATPVAVRAQEQDPYEDVVMQGRLLRPDGSPAANTPVVVTTSSGFGFFSFFATLGLSTLACFGGANGVCPVQPGKAWHTVTDANGRYSFTFKDAKRPGEQTDTDYFFNAGIASKTNPKTIVVASYELELLTSVHNAPDVTLWDPPVSLTPRELGYEVSYPPRKDSANGARVYFGDKEAPATTLRNGVIDAREVEDSVFSVVPTASKDVTAEGTIYHQRFRAASITRRGTLVPISRDAPCTATRKDGTRLQCSATDGDLATRSVADEETCEYEPDGTPEWFNRADCKAPVTELTIDLGQPKEVGEVRPRCGGCALTGSKDGASWVNLPASGAIGTPRALRYIRLTSTSRSLSYVPEVSVWPGDDIERISPAEPDSTSTTTGEVAAISPTKDQADEDDELSAPWMEILLTFAVISAVAVYLFQREKAQQGRA